MGKRMVRWQWFGSDAEVINAARRIISQAAIEAIEAQGTFRLVLAGGTTPRAVYPTLRELDRLGFGISTGTNVLPADPQSKYKMAQDAWARADPHSSNPSHRARPARQRACAAAFGCDRIRSGLARLGRGWSYRARFLIDLGAAAEPGCAPGARCPQAAAGASLAQCQSFGSHASGFVPRHRRRQKRGGRALEKRRTDSCCGDPLFQWRRRAARCRCVGGELN